MLVIVLIVILRCATQEWFFMLYVDSEGPDEPLNWCSLISTLQNHTVECIPEHRRT